MTPEQVELLLLARYGVRADPATRAYVVDKLAGPVPFPILAGDARTGRAVRQVVVPADLVRPAVATA